MKNKQFISTNQTSNFITSTSAPGAGVIPLRNAANCVQWFADGPTSDLVNFPFAFIVTIFFVIGLSAVVWGLFLASIFLAILGVLVTLLGSFLCGLSRYE